MISVSAVVIRNHLLFMLLRIAITVFVVFFHIANSDFCFIVLYIFCHQYEYLQSI